MSFEKKERFFPHFLKSNSFHFKLIPLPLVDNNTRDEQEYSISIQVSWKTTAEMNRDIHIELYGEEGTTGQRTLDDGVRKVRIFP